MTGPGRQTQHSQKFSYFALQDWVDESADLETNWKHCVKIVSKVCQVRPGENGHFLVVISAQNTIQSQDIVIIYNHGQFQIHVQQV